jgi:hypothetical protein
MKRPDSTFPLGTTRDRRFPGVWSSRDGRARIIGFAFYKTDDKSDKTQPLRLTARQGTSRRSRSAMCRVMLVSSDDYQSFAPDNIIFFTAPYKQSIRSYNRAMRGIDRRLSRLEESIPVALTAATFAARAHGLAKRSRLSISSAMDTLLKDLSDGELASLGAEFEQVAFGSDLAARDAAKREVFAAAGCPVLDKHDPPGVEECIW